DIGGNDEAKGTTRDGTSRSIALPAERDHRHEPCPGEAYADDRLVVPGAAVRGSLRGQAGAAAVADPPDGRTGDPQAHLRPLRRGAVRALGGEPLLPAVLWRGVFPAPAGVRSLLA